MSRSTSKARKKPEQFGYYLVEITAWDFTYHLSSNGSRWDDDPVSEYPTIEVLGRLLGPTSAGCSSATISLTASAAMAREARTAAGRERHRVIGSVEKRGEVLTGYIPIPEQALVGLLPVFVADRFRMLILHGPRLFRSKALVTSVSVETTLKAEDYPTDYHS